MIINKFSKHGDPRPAMALKSNVKSNGSNLVYESVVDTGGDVQRRFGMAVHSDDGQKPRLDREPGF